MASEGILRTQGQFHNYQMSKDTYTLGKQQLLHKLVIHPVHRKVSRYTPHKVYWLHACI